MLQKGCTGDVVNAKLAAYSCVPAAHTFVPFVLEASGALGAHALTFLAKCAHLRRDSLVQERDFATWAARSFSPFWRQRLSVRQHSVVGMGICARAAEDVYLRHA